MRRNTIILLGLGLLLSLAGETVPGVAGDEKKTMQPTANQTTLGLESFGLRVSVSQPRVISQAKSYHWFPNALHRLNDGSLLVGLSLCADAMVGDLAEGYPQALLKSIDQGANWFRVNVVRGGLYEAYPSWQLPDGTLLGMSNALMNYSGEAYFLEWRSRDGAKTWDGPRQVPVRVPEGAIVPYDEPGHRYAGLGVGGGGLLQMPNGDLLVMVDGKFRGDKGTRLCLFKYTEATGCWSYVSTIGDSNVEGVTLNESDLLRLPDGSLLTVIRQEGGKPMYQSKSTDGGQTWSRPRPMAACGVRPRLRRLSNGVVACSYGRVTEGPSLGDHIVFSVDGGETWTSPTIIYHAASTGYTSMLETSPNELLYVYDELAAGWTESAGSRIMSVNIQVERK